jgi:hypothetical protein
VLFPRDGQAGGTWIATSERATLCLLNGAFTAHPSCPPYRHSRGLVILNYFGYATTDAFIHHYPTEGLEPFTLVIRDGAGLRELRWDGARRFTRALDPGAPHLWASATLYGPDALENRQRWFDAWLAAHPDPDPAALRTFTARPATATPATTCSCAATTCRPSASPVSFTGRAPRKCGTNRWESGMEALGSSRS